MAEVELIVKDEVKHLKKEIKNLQNELGQKDATKEELLTFDMLEKYLHITQQQAWPWRRENFDALYTFTDQIPAWVVDDAVMATQASGEQGLLNSYMNWDSKHTEAGMALMLSRVPSCLRVGDGLEGEKVYSTVVMFVHPKQELLTIKEGAESLLQFAEQPDADITVLCELPSHRYGRFYPSTINHAYLVLPYCGKKGKPKQLRLDLTMCYNHYHLVHRLHRWKGKHGDLVLLLPVFSTDPTLPILLPVRHIGELWVNAIYTTPVPAGGTGMVAVCPSISRLTCCCQEVIAGKTLADWTEEERMVYPSPPTPLTPKDDEADGQDNDPTSHSKGSSRSNVEDCGNKGLGAEDGNRSEHSDKLVDDDKSEHGGRSGEDAMPKKKEDNGSEGESDNQSKTPKDQTAVSNDSGLGTSGSGDGVGAGPKAGAVVSYPGINLSTGLPLPTQLPSMDLLERLADNLYAYSGELFWGLEEMSMVMLDRVLSGFKKLGGRAQEYIFETAAIAINFFSRAGDMEKELESSEALKFREAVDSMKESICNLIRQTASVEETYEDSAANFNNILALVSDELKEYVELQGEEQRQTYIAKCLEWVRGVHGSLDRTQFIPMIILNVTTHHALALNQRVNQSQIPLQIMISPMRAQAATMGASLKFIEFLSKWVLALDVKLGLTSSVSIESGGEGAGVQSTSGEGGKTTAMVTSPPTSPKKHDPVFSAKSLVPSQLPPGSGTASNSSGW